MDDAKQNLYKTVNELKSHGKMKLSTDNPFTPDFVKSNVDVNDREGFYRSRVLGRQMLLENPARESRAKREAKREAKEKAERRKRSNHQKKLGIVGRRESREKGLWELEVSQRRFSLFLPLHQLWLGYMSELLGLPQLATSHARSTPSSTSMHPKLVKADFHGSIMTVKQAKNPALIGLQGIVIHETENAFKVITKDNKLKMLPKQNSIFAFAVPLHSTFSASPAAAPDTATSSATSTPLSSDLSTVLDKPHMLFTLYGNQFRFRSADRAARKFKPKMTIEL